MSAPAVEVLYLGATMRRELEALIVADVIAFVYLVREAFLLDAIREYDAIVDAWEALFDSHEMRYVDLPVKDDDE